MSRTVIRVCWWLALSGALLYSGGCSLKSVGAGLLSEFLTTGGTSALGSGLTSGLGSLLGAGT